jgi:ribonuclease HI
MDGDSHPGFRGLAQQQCAVCSSDHPPLHCSGCKVVSYCSITHQSSHISKHIAVCDDIKQKDQALQGHEMAYMRARFAAASALLEVGTKRAVEDALDHFSDMLRLCRTDNLGMRDIIPALLLRLGRDQECYDFLKWWATAFGDNNHSSKIHGWGDTLVPFLDIRGVNLFESIEPFRSGRPSLAHLVALTLLKLRWCQYLMPVKDLSDRGPNLSKLDRSYSGLMLGRLIGSYGQDMTRMAETLEGQYRTLCQMVNDRNPYFWELLVDDGDGDPPSPPSHYTEGSADEAILTVHQLKRAWQETEDAMVMIQSETRRFRQVYPSKGVAAVVRRGSGRVFPTGFGQSTSSMLLPETLFPATGFIASGQALRFVHRDNWRRMMAYTDGACANNGQLDPQAGWAVVYGWMGEGDGDDGSGYASVSARLERRGPFGHETVPTSNRAELRAVIAALRLRDWSSDKFDNIVLATDSTYVVDGATRWAKSWVHNGWKTHTGDDVKNRDLWEVLLGEVERWHERGVWVELWRIPRELNTAADAAAKKAVKVRPALTNFTDVRIDLSAGSRTDPKTDLNTILVLCLDGERQREDTSRDLPASLNRLSATIERAATAETALLLLDRQPPASSAILITDGALKSSRAGVRDKVLDHLYRGATVVLAGCFSSKMTDRQFNRFFAQVGLPWRRGSCKRATVRLQSEAVSNELQDQLLSTYSQEAVFVKNVERSEIWYASNDQSSREPEAAVALTKVGEGRLGYVGYVNGMECSSPIIRAMCGLLG